jgi:hypothetical protein
MIAANETIFATALTGCMTRPSFKCRSFSLAELSSVKAKKVFTTPIGANCGRAATQETLESYTGDVVKGANDSTLVP